MTDSTDTCDECGHPIPDEYDKHDPKAPVYGPGRGEVRHHDCSDELFEEVYCEVSE